MLWAVTAKHKSEIHVYYLARIFTFVPLEVIRHFWGHSSNFYRIVYCGATLAILWVSWGIVRAAGITLAGASVAAIWSLLVAGIAFCSLPRWPDTDVWIMLTAGTLVMWLAIMLAFAGWRKMTLGTLSFLWLVLASVFFIRAIDPVAWHEMAGWGTYMIGISGDGWMGTWPRIKSSS